MTTLQDKDPPVALFDETMQALRAARARRRHMKARPFLLERVIGDLSERLQDVNRTFVRVCLVGPFDWRDQIIASLPKPKQFETFDHHAAPTGEDYDLVISLLHMQSLNAIGGWMQAVRTMLVPDGLFLSCLIGGTSLSELRRTFYAIDTDRFGAPTARIHPMIEVRAAAQLLGHAGLAIPVTDSDRFTVYYRKVETLAGDLRDLGLTNALTDRDRRVSASMIRDIETALRPVPDEAMPISWEIIWMTGWVPHESQQKPLKPGSARMGLNDALKSIRDGQKS